MIITLTFMCDFIAHSIWNLKNVIFLNETCNTKNIRDIICDKISLSSLLINDKNRVIICSRLYKDLNIIINMHILCH